MKKRIKRFIIISQALAVIAVSVAGSIRADGAGLLPVNAAESTAAVDVFRRIVLWLLGSAS